MPEAITKYAINSTLGTERFKPLDQIIEGQRSLAASDSVIAVLQSVEERVMDWSCPKTIMPKKSGSVRFLIEASPVDVAAEITLRAYDSSHAIVGEKTIYINTEDSGTEHFSLSLDFNVEKEESYSFEAESPTRNYWFLLYAAIGANVVDVSLIEVGE